MKVQIKKWPVTIHTNKEKRKGLSSAEDQTKNIDSLLLF
ncbi:hypothetical protein M2372_004607 [Chryseobacterium sp. BIGb0232]|nr:hypothetical protein [Chryseobacterium sp. BIGb0232]ROS07729.1 hypothetical protein EDF65_4844 [Chryseobacterium nakagawai]